MRTGTGLVPLVHNLEVVGYHDLAGRPAFKLAIQKVDERWYLYMGHLWHRGWSILDVTEPARPELLSFIAGPANTWTIQMQVAGSRMVTGLERIAPGWGDEPGAPFGEGFIIWDVSEPASPVELGRWQTGSTGSHRNFYDGGNLVHVAGAAPGLHRKIYRIVDVSEPTSPRRSAGSGYPSRRGRIRTPGSCATVRRPSRTGLPGCPMVRAERSSSMCLISAGRSW